MQKKILLLFWREARRYPMRLALLLAGAILTPLCGSFVGPYIISRFLDLIQRGGDLSFTALWPLIAVYAATQIYGDIIGWRLNLYLVWMIEVTADGAIHRKVFKHLLDKSLSFHANAFGGSLVSQTNKLVGAFERFWDTITFQLLPAVTSIIAAVSILAFIFWQYALFLAFFSIVFILLVFFGSRHMAELNKHEAQASSRQTGQLADAITNILAIKSYGTEASESIRYDQSVKAWQKTSFATMRAFLTWSSGYSSVLVIINVGALCAAAWAAQRHIASVATIFLCITYTFTVARQVWEMNSVMRNYNRIMGDAADMAEILDTAPELIDPGNAELVRFQRGGIEFRNVVFQYTDNDETEPLFNELNLRIKPGEKVGLIGRSGGGKTTITKLILRFMDIAAGQILIDNQDIANLKQSEFRAYISYVSQEPLLFHRSLSDNIAYGRPHATQQEIEAVAKMAHAHQFISKLPDGYNTLVGERGIKLSGGQRQRIAIARAMLKNAPILLLDEATSALDSESESLIQDTLWKLMESKTAVVIAHRLSTIQKMDRILVLDQGAIVEEGSHTELLAQKGLYASLWAHQSGGFIED